jgi:hypothetical protein
LFRFNTPGHTENGVVRAIVLVEKGLHVFERGVFHVLEFQADGGPAVGVGGIGQLAEQVPHVAVGLVDVVLLEFFADHLALHLQAARTEVQQVHPIRFEP